MVSTKVLLEPRAQACFEECHGVVLRDMNRGSVIFLVTLLVFGVTLNAVWATDHTASFLDLDYATWANHTFALGSVGQFIPNSVDVFQYRGQYYSALAPGLALLAFPFVVPGFIVEGHFSEYGTVMLSSELFVAVLNALAALYLYKLSRMYFREATATFIALAYAFSTVSWPFATFFFQSDVSAAFDVIAVYSVLRATRGSGGSVTILVGGLSVAAAMTVDYVNFLLMPVLLVYIIVSLRKDYGLLAKGAAEFALCSFFGVLAIGLYNYASFGQVLVSSEQLYLHSPSVLGEFSTPLYLGMVLNLFTPLRGIFLYSPVLLAGVFGFRKMVGAPAVRREGLLLLTVFTALFLPYCAWYGPTGGLSFGPRFIVASLPFLLLPAGYVIESGWRYRGPVVYILYSAGVVINGLAALTSALAGNTGWLTSPFLDSTVTLLAHGTLDQWWAGVIGRFWPLATGTVIAAALLLPDILGRASGQGPDARWFHTLFRPRTQAQGPCPTQLSNRRANPNQAQSPILGRLRRMTRPGHGANPNEAKTRMSTRSLQSISMKIRLDLQSTKLSDWRKWTGGVHPTSQMESNPPLFENTTDCTKPSRWNISC